MKFNKGDKVTVTKGDSSFFAVGDTGVVISYRDGSPRLVIVAFNPSETVKRQLRRPDGSSHWHVLEYSLSLQFNDEQFCFPFCLGSPPSS